MAHRFEEANVDGRSLDAVIDYVLTLRMRPTKVALRLLASPSTGMCYVLTRRKKSPRPLSLVLVDADHFKSMTCMDILQVARYRAIWRGGLPPPDLRVMYVQFSEKSGVICESLRIVLHTAKVGSGMPGVLSIGMLKVDGDHRCNPR